MYAYKAAKQNYTPSPIIKELMEKFRSAVNISVGVAMEKNLTSRNSVSKEAYHLLTDLNMPSYYYPEAINKAVALVKTYKRNIRKGRKATAPRMNRLILSTYYGFKMQDGNILIPVANRKYEKIPLNGHTQEVTSTAGVHSFALSAYTLSLTVGREVEVLECTATVGVDRNLRNASVGNEIHHETYDLSNVVEIKQRYRSKISHFRRNDVRIGKKIAFKYGRRSGNRVKDIVHRTSKDIVTKAIEQKEAIVLENIKGISQITKKGDGKGRNYRFLLKNSFPYGMLAGQITYKAQWEGLPVHELSRKETRNTSKQCSVCGSLTRIEHDRTLKCDNCGLEIDRDINACINIAGRGRTWLKRSHEGPSAEAVKQLKDAEQMMTSRLNEMQRDGGSIILSLNYQ